MRTKMAKHAYAGMAVVLSAIIALSPFTQCIYAEETTDVSIGSTEIDSAGEKDDNSAQETETGSAESNETRSVDQTKTDSENDQKSQETGREPDSSAETKDLDGEDSSPAADNPEETKDSTTEGEAETKENPSSAENSATGGLEEAKAAADQDNPESPGNADGNDEEENADVSDINPVVTGSSASESKWSLQQTEIKRTISSFNYELDFNDTEINYIHINSDDYDLYFSAASSDESVVKLYDDVYIYEDAYFECVGPGTATITITDQYGNAKTCEVTIDTEEISFEKESVSFNLSEEYLSVGINGGYNPSFVSSDTSVVTVSTEDYWGFFELKAISPGTATVTAADPTGKTKSIEVTVTPPEWQLDSTQKTVYLSSQYDYMEAYCDYDGLNFTVTSSNPKVVKVPAKVSSDGSIEIEYLGVGTSTITVTDQFGTSATCKITVKPDPISFGEYAVLTLNRYVDFYDGYDLYSDGNNIIASVSSSNTKVVKASRVKEDDDYYLSIVPVAAGTAVITAKDQYGQSATMKVTITQRFIDESRYLEDLECSYIHSALIYGQSAITCSCPISASVYTTINNKKYTGTVNSDGDYVIRGLPRLKAGTKVSVVFQKGQAKYTQTFTVQKKFGGGLKTTIKQQTYTGKALKPAVRIVYGKITLKVGTDYTVKYSNNKNVGTAKATITFKGNYKGAKSATFKINPKATNFTKLKALKKGFTATWKKQASQTTGYQIQYCTNKKFSSGVKTVTITSNKTLKKTIKKLAKKKKYFLRIRTYKKIKKVNYYSAWSKVWNVTTKK